MSEDCLALNVWAPADTESGPRPVVVWVHGSGQVVDGTANRLYDGTRLASRGVVVVSVAYRLGALGFLRLRHLLGEEFAGSENNALRDIAQSLRWVHDNIAAFGGDPDRITLAGQSAGAKNTINSLAIPAVREIVSGAISESGSALTLLTPQQAEGVTASLLEQLGIADTDAERLLSVDAKKLVAAQRRLRGVNFPWRAVVDGTVLPTTVLAAARAGALRHIALLIGSTANEYDTFAVVNRSLGSSDPTTASTTHIRSPESLRRMLGAYEGLFGPAVTGRDRRIQLLTAEEYWIPSLRLIEAQCAAGGSVHGFRFDWHPRVRHPLHLRAAHGMELPFVFGTLSSMNARFFTLLAGKPERRLVGQVQESWTKFITAGRPADPDRWPAYGADRNVMLINETWTMTQDPNGRERSLWDGVL